MGVRDRDILTNLLFWARHPEMMGEKIQKGQQGLARDWRNIRDTIVEPGLRSKRSGSGRPGATPETRKPNGQSTGPGGGQPQPTGPASAGGATLRDESLAAFVAGLKNPAADAVADELAMLQETSSRLLTDKSGHEETEEKGAGRDELVAGIARLRGRVSALDGAGLAPPLRDELKRRVYLAINEISPFYSQGRNIDLLEGKEQAKELGTTTEWSTRTCNITSLSMALEAMGKSANDYDSAKRDQIAAVAAAFRPEVSSATLTVSGGDGDWGSFAGLRLSDFMQLAAIAELLKSGKPSATEITAAAKTAWGEILSIYFLGTLARRFGATTDIKPFTLDVSKTFKEQDKEAGRFKAWAGQHRSKTEQLVDLRNRMAAAEGKAREKIEAQYLAKRKELEAAFGEAADKAVDLESYRSAMTTQIGPELQRGSQVEVALAGHYVRLQAIHNDHVTVDDPAQVGRANRKVTWEEARAMGYFYYRLVING